MKKGFTLIELIVAMTLFIIVVTMAIGAFVAISRTKTLMNDMKETQQKLRLISEMVTRYSKEANSVSTGNNAILGGDYLELTYIDYTQPLKPVTSDRFFVLHSPDLGYTPPVPDYDRFKFYDCEVTASGYQHEAWDTIGNCSQEDLLSAYPGTTYVVDKIGGADVFKETNTDPATLQVNFNLINASISATLGGDSILYSNKIILEGLK